MFKLAYRVYRRAVRVRAKVFKRIWTRRHLALAWPDKRAVFPRRRVVRLVGLLYQRYVYPLLLRRLKRPRLRPRVLNHNAPKRRQFVGLKRQKPVVQLAPRPLQRELPPARTTPRLFHIHVLKNYTYPNFSVFRRTLRHAKPHLRQKSDGYAVSRRLGGRGGRSGVLKSSANCF